MSAGDLTLTFPADRSQLVYDDIVAQHRQRVVRTAYRIVGNLDDAQDVAQEVFLRLLRHLDKIEGDPRAWLYRVTANLCSDRFRRQRPLTEIADRPDTSVRADEALLLDERKRLLMEGLRTLPPSQRAAVVLRDIEGLSTRETAEALGVEEVTVRSQISLARVKLAKYVRSRQ